MSKITNRLFVLGIDGIPYSLLSRFLAKGMFQNLSRILDGSNMKEMKSVYPVISSVAWTGFATGVNPGQHGIFGFVDRKASPFQITIPTSRERKAEPIWTTLSKLGKKIIVINVPITYPVEPVNGKMVSCFLCPDIEKGVYPKDLVPFLKKHNYIIDADSWLARVDKSAFLKEVCDALDARFEVALNLENDWDYFQLHIMETDRLMHFFWYDIENAKSEYYQTIRYFFNRLDMWIGKLLEKLKEDDSLFILSDHGFCGIKHEVRMNAWLKEKGYLVMNENTCDINDYNEKTICYSILPGRFYVNLKGREARGSVPLEEYEAVRRMVKKELLNFRDPENDQPIIRDVFFKEEIYDGSYLEDAPDIIAHPNNGYDLKGMAQNDLIFGNSELTGMHTYEDAVIIGKNISIKNINTIEDVRREIMKLYKA